MTIARSRKHVQKYYKDSGAKLGSFPNRTKPVSIYPDIDLQGKFIGYDGLNDQIDHYKLSLFNLALCPKQGSVIFETSNVAGFARLTARII